MQIGGQSADIWAGTTAEYNQLPTYDAHKLYLTVDIGQTTTAKLFAGSVIIADSDFDISALAARVTALENTAVLSTGIRTIQVVTSMPANPLATILYVVEGT